jgi:hypothetical protein
MNLQKKFHFKTKKINNLLQVVLVNVQYPDVIFVQHQLKFDLNDPTKENPFFIVVVFFSCNKGLTILLPLLNRCCF